MTKRLYRNEKDAMIGGVATGMADYLNIDPTIVRIIWIIFTATGGAGILVYILLWIIIPAQKDTDKTTFEIIENNKNEVIKKIKSTPNDKNKVFWGILLVFTGFYFLVETTGILRWLHLNTLWPLVIIVSGIVLIIRNENNSNRKNNK